MRLILFRGKDVDTQKWIYGQYIHLHKTTYCCVGSEEQEKENQIHQIVFERMTDWNLPNQHLRADVIAETIGQYTGINDKKGNRIFEGDIVQFVFGKNNEQSVKYRVDFKFGEFTLISDSGGEMFIARAAECEVVGNIYDNPELKKTIREESNT